jgi:guanylate kinase
LSKFLLLLGPSGVGKSAIIDELLKLDAKFVYISPYMTRSLRPGEKNKIPISEEQMNEMERRGEFLVVNTLFGGIRYGTPSLPIIQAFGAGDYPILDWPVDRLLVMRQTFPEQLFTVYISPPSIHVLRERLAKDGRDVDGTRLASAEKELQRYLSSKYAGLYNLEIISKDNEILEIATKIYIGYLKSFKYAE